jgi:molybdenum cofactor synthesis domain-containing protein
VRTAAILIVGDEVLSGEVVDANAPFLLARLAALGARVVRTAAVRDVPAEVVDEVRRMRAVADVVLVAGGIGPTHDDVTRPAIAAALGVPLERLPAAVGHIRRWFGDATTEAELSMADLPRGSRLIRGAKTSALGFAVAGVFVFPGVPFLLRDLVEGSAAEFTGEPLHRAEVTTELREGEIAQALTEIQGGSLDAAIGSYPSMDAEGVWRTRIVVRSLDRARAEAVAADVLGAFARITAGK